MMSRELALIFLSSVENFSVSSPIVLDSTFPPQFRHRLRKCRTASEAAARNSAHRVGPLKSLADGKKKPYSVNIDRAGEEIRR